MRRLKHRSPICGTRKPELLLRRPTTRELKWGQSRLPLKAGGHSFCHSLRFMRPKTAEVTPCQSIHWIHLTTATDTSLHLGDSLTLSHRAEKCTLQTILNKCWTIVTDAFRHIFFRIRSPHSLSPPICFHNFDIKDTQLQRLDGRSTMTHHFRLNFNPLGNMPTTRALRQYRHI